jgi:YcxB-like protein
VRGGKHERKIEMTEMITGEITCQAPLQYEFDLTEADYRAFRRHVSFRRGKMHWIYILSLVISFLIVWNRDVPGNRLDVKIITACISMIIIICCGLLFGWLAVTLRKFASGKPQPILGHHTLEIAGDTIVESNSAAKTEMKLSFLKSIDETRRHFFLMTRNNLGFVVPKRGLTDFQPLRELAEKVGKSS